MTGTQRETKTERKTQRQRGTEKDTQRQPHRYKYTHRDRQRERERERVRHTETHRNRHRGRDRHNHDQRERERETRPRCRWIKYQSIKQRDGQFPCRLQLRQDLLHNPTADIHNLASGLSHFIPAFSRDGVIIIHTLPHQSRTPSLLPFGRNLRVVTLRH